MQKKIASKADLSRMPLTLRATSLNISRRFALGAGDLCLVREKTRRAPSWQYGDAGVYGHSNTARRNMGTHPPPCVRIFLRLVLSRAMMLDPGRLLLTVFANGLIVRW